MGHSCASGESLNAVTTAVMIAVLFCMPFGKGDSDYWTLHSGGSDSDSAGGSASRESSLRAETASCYIDEEHTFQIAAPSPGFFAASSTLAIDVEIPCCVSQQDVFLRSSFSGGTYVWRAATTASRQADGTCVIRLMHLMQSDTSSLHRGSLQVTVDLFPASAKAISWPTLAPQPCGELSLDCRSTEIRVASVATILLEGLRSIEAWAGLTFLFTEYGSGESLYLSAMPGELMARFDGQLPSLKGLTAGALWILAGPSSANVLSASIAAQEPTAESIPFGWQFFRVAWFRGGSSVATFQFGRISWTMPDPPDADALTMTVHMQADLPSVELLGTTFLIGATVPVTLNAELTSCETSIGMPLSLIRAQFATRLPAALATAQLTAPAGLHLFDTCVYLADRHNLSSGWVWQDRVIFQPAGGMHLLNPLLTDPNIRLIPRMRPGYDCPAVLSCPFLSCPGTPGC